MMIQCKRNMHNAMLEKVTYAKVAFFLREYRHGVGYERVFEA